MTAASSVARPAVSASHVLSVLGTALLLGAAADGLFKDAAPGLNVFLWIAGLSAWATFLSSRYAEVHAAPDWWQLPAVLFAAGFALRADPDLLVLDALAVAGAMTLPILRARGVEPVRAGAMAIVRAGAWLAGQVAAGIVLLLAELPWGEVGASESARRAGRVATGLLIAIPLLLVFGALLADADPVIGAAVADLADVDLGSLPVHLALVGGFGALAAGFLRARLWGARPGAPAARTPTFDPTAILVAVASVAGVFVLFVALQARALVGGAGYVLATTGLTLAEYARSGFFQCMTAAGLSLPVLYVADLLVPADDAHARASLRALAGLQLLLIGAVVASAAVRLELYIGAFGLTTDRVFGVAGLAWVVLTAGWFALTVLRGRRERFVFGAMLSGFVTLAALNFANPQAVVVGVNVARAAHGASLDTEYLGTLGPDAAPAIAAALPALDPERCHEVATALAQQWGGTPATDVRSWNYARWRANAAANVAAASRSSCAKR